MRRSQLAFLTFALVVASSCTTDALSPSPTIVIPSRPTDTPLPSLSSSLILDSKEAIAYSYNLLLQMGLEKGFTADQVDYVPVQFPDGNKGAFIAFGFSGPTRGYQFLYRLSGDKIASVELVTSGVGWGISRKKDKVDIEFLELFPNPNEYSQQLLKVTGLADYGSSLWDDGYFQIIDVTDGIQVIFQGSEVEVNGNPEGWYNQYQYQYLDLDNDGVKEIIKEGEECKPGFNDEEKKWEPTSPCESIREIYRFNGVEYISDS